MNSIHSLALFCGSSCGNSPRFIQLAKDFGNKCAEQKVTLYYGGAKLGLMNAAAEAAIQAGGTVIGVTPDFFSHDTVVAQNITKLILVKTMSERKQLLEKIADAFVIFPGSFGTMDELFEIITDAQLGLHAKPVVILNVFGYYDHLLQQLHTFRNEGFLRPCHYDLLHVATSVDELFDKIRNYSNSNDLEWIKAHTKREARSEC